MDEFIASETEESSMSLTSEDEKPKRSESYFILPQVHPFSAHYADMCSFHVPCPGRRNGGRVKVRARTSPTVMTWR